MYPPSADAGHCAPLQSLVAGPGFEPGTQGYEPRMMPFHYPAITQLSSFYQKKAETQVLIEKKLNCSIL